MSHIATLARRLKKILPMLQRGVHPVDRMRALEEFSRLFMEYCGVDFDETLDAVLNEIADEASPDSFQSIENTVTTAIDEMPVELQNEKGNPVTLYSIGFLASGLQNSPLRTSTLSEEAAEELREILYKHYFNRKACRLQIFEATAPLNHAVVADVPPSVDFLSDLIRDGRPFVPASAIPDGETFLWPDEEEEKSVIAAHFRLIFIAVERTSKTLPLLKSPYTGLGFSCEVNSQKPVWAPDRTLASPYGAEMNPWLQRFGTEFRYTFTEPYLLNDTVRQLDYVVGMKRVLLMYSRVMLDEKIEANQVVTSFGIFSDPLRGYSELRVGFARSDACENLVAGVPLPLPSTDADAAGEELINFVQGLLYMHGLRTPDPAAYKHGPFVAEPESCARLYNTVTGLQKPVATKSLHPTEAAALRYN